MRLSHDSLFLCALAAACLSVGNARAQSAADRVLIESLNTPALPNHIVQGDLVAEVAAGFPADAFLRAFLHGDVVFDTNYNTIDGIGANVGSGKRFTRVPRADLTGPGQWANHFPSRATGPNAQGCTQCHGKPFADGAGDNTANAVRDPLHSGDPGQMIERNTPHLFGSGALQRLAEEMTTELQAQREALRATVTGKGKPAQVDLIAKGVSFGRLRAQQLPGGGVVFNTGQVVGVDADLVVRPFQWKGSVASLRDFNRGAAHNEIGLQAIELVGQGVDGDGDQVVDELTVGDITTMTIYVAAQPRPVTTPELSQLGLGAALSFQDVLRIEHGKLLFTQIGCAECHKPRLVIDVPIFQEPSAHPAFRDSVFPGGQDPLLMDVRPDMPIAFDLTRDQPQNKFVVNGTIVHLGALEKLPNGSAAVDLYGDLKRHDMGPGLAESIDETGAGSSVFLTENLWGMASTGPYLHDGRATTATEAILWHGGEAQASRDAFRNLRPLEQQDLLSFLDSLVLIRGGLPIGN